jgi:hypothetical protein
MADPPTEGQTRDTGRADDAARRDEPKGLRRRVEIEPGRTPIGVRDPPLTVHLDPAQQRKVDHQTTLTDAVPGRVVPAPTHRHFQIVQPCEIERRRDIAPVEATHDHGRTSIDQSVEAAARQLVTGVARSDHDAGQRPPQPAQIRVHQRSRVDSLTHQTPKETDQSGRRSPDRRSA